MRAAGYAAAQQQSENRQYMTQVNQTMDDLKSRLESFTDAVSRGDVVGMRTQADNAFKAIDDLNNLTSPTPSRISRRSTSTARPISRTR